MEGRSRGNREAQVAPQRGEALNFLDLLERLPPQARPQLLIEERERLEKNLAKVIELLEGTPA